MSFAVKVTVSIAGKFYGENGTKFVTRGNGEIHTTKTRAGAEALVVKCNKAAISGITETFEIVEL